MRHAGLIVSCLLAGWPGITAVAAGAPEGHRSALAVVAALDKPVTYTEMKIPLGELVQKVAADAGAKLTASQGVADEPVAVVVKEMPARELLEQVAELLDYRWSRLGQEGAWRYEIWQDLASKQREEALRQRVITGAAAGLRAQLQREGLMARVPSAQLQAAIDDFEQRSKEREKQTSDEQQAFYYSRQGYDFYRRYIAATAVAKPVARVQADLLSRLSPEQWAALWANRELIFSSQPVPGEFPLPAETERQFRAAKPSATTMHIFRMVQGGLLDQEAPSEKDQAASWATAAGYRVRVRLEASQQRSHGTLGLEASTQPILEAGATDSFSFRPQDSLDLSVGPGDIDPPILEDTPRRRAALEKDPLLARRETFRPAAKPVKDADGPGATPAWNACELLPDLARTYGANLIADAYWRDEPVTVSLTDEPQPLHHWLDAICLPYQRWERRGSLIRLRSRTWFMERPRETPLRFVRRWSESYFDHGGLSLGEYLGMATGLTESQSEALEEEVGILVGMKWLPKVAEELSVVRRARYLLRLYASFSPQQLQQLAAGRDLHFTELTSTQRPLFLAALNDISLRNHAEFLASSTLVRWDEARFSVAAGRYTWVPMEDGSLFLRPEPEARPAAQSGAADSTSLGRRPAPPASSNRLWPAVNVPGRSGRPAIRWDAPRRTTLEQIEMELNAGPDLHEGFALPVARLPE